MVHALNSQAVGRLARAVFFCALLAPSIAYAQEAAPAVEAAETAPKVDIAEQVRILATADFTAKRDAASVLAATGDPRMAPILQALLDGNLYARKSDNLV